MISGINSIFQNVGYVLGFCSAGHILQLQNTLEFWLDIRDKTYCQLILLLHSNILIS